MQRIWIAMPVVVIAAGLIGGCLSTTGRSLPEPVEGAFEKPNRVTLYSLEPGPWDGTDTSDDKTFHGHRILGQVDVEDAATQKKLFAAFRKGVADHDGSVAACFIPHHGISIQCSGKLNLDMVVCFKCAQVKIFKNGNPEESILISTTPRATFNEILRAAKVPLSKDAE